MKKLVSLAFGTLSLASLIAVSGCKVTFKPIERDSNGYDMIYAESIEQDNIIKDNLND